MTETEFDARLKGKMLRRLLPLPFCLVLLGLVRSSQAQVTPPMRRTLLKVVVAHLENHLYGKHKEFADFCGKRSPWDAGIVDAHDPWAFVNVGRREDKRGNAAPDYLLPDGAFFLLKRQNGKWRVVKMGTDNSGVGEEMHVPKRYWKKWGIE